MSKKILVMRHAKSSWSQPGLKDFDRPLNNRGKRDAPKMGRFLSRENIVPDQIFSSTAARARATALALSNGAEFNREKINWNGDLYYGGPDAYIVALRGSAQDSDIVMTVGHNPMTEEVIDMLAGDIVAQKIATATIACFETDVEEWKQTAPGNCRLLWVKGPKDVHE